MATTSRKLERKIQHEIMEALGCEPDLILLRNTGGTARVYNADTGRMDYITFGLGTGSPDLVGILRCEVGGAVVGHWFCLELKRPGEKPRPEQVAVHKAWRWFGAFVGV